MDRLFFLFATFMLLCLVLHFNVLCLSSPFTFPFFSSLVFLLCLLLLLLFVCPCPDCYPFVCSMCFNFVCLVLCFCRSSSASLLLHPSLSFLPSLSLDLIPRLFYNHAQAVFESFVGVSLGRVPGLKYRRRKLFFPHSIRLPAREIMKHWVSAFIPKRLTVGLLPTQV